jgi:hypothetical protein
MFDTLPIVSRDLALAAVQSLFFDLVHRLAEAARLIGGVSAEAQVVALGVQLANTPQMTDRIRRDLVALHRLLALDEVSAGSVAETTLLSGFNLASPQVEEICLLTDLLEDLLETIGPRSLHLPPASLPTPVQLPAQHAA